MWCTWQALGAMSQPGNAQCRSRVMTARRSAPVIRLVGVPVSSGSLRHIKRQMDLASQRGARVAHFPEGALSGYAGTDFPTFVTISTLLRRRAT
jgi:hypothetical protein